MLNGGSPKGLGYKKLDLHVHTPASKCFSGQCTADELVETAIAKGLDAIAITDHNTGAWIDTVKEAAQGKAIAIFPGVEISCTGGQRCIHIVGLFDTASTTRHIEALLNVLHIGPDDYGQQDALTNKSPVDVIEAIHEAGGIPVLAHANSSNGVLGDMSGQARTRIIQMPCLLAAEATDYGDEDKRNRRRRTIDFLDGSDPTYKRKLAVYQASDNPCPDGSGRHCLEGIGTRYSFFKMEQITLEGLRQCLIDPSVRIKQDDQLLLGKYPYIKSLKVTSGFLDGQEVTFHPGLTTILGAKGAGKSLLIEFMRFALNQEPRIASVSQDHNAKLNARLGEYGIVEVRVCDEHGAETPFSRTYRELDGSPFDSTQPFDPAQVFPVLFLSQNEIIRIAEDEREQLQFIDQFFDFRTYRSKIASIEKELERLDAQMAEGLRAYSEYEEAASQVKNLDKEIAGLDVALQNPIFEQFKELEKKEKALLLQRDHLDAVLDGIGTSRQLMLKRTIPEIPKSLEKDPALSRNMDIIRGAHAKIAEHFEELLREIKVHGERARQEYDTWHPKYLTGKKEYEDSVQQMGGDYKAIALARERLTRQRTEQQRKLDVLKSRKDEVPAISKQRNDLLDALDAEYQAYTEQRHTKCEKFQKDSHEKLRLRILDRSNVEEFRNGLLTLKRGSYLRDDEIALITQNVNPRDFVISLLRYDATKASQHLEKIAQDSSIELRRMKTLADYLIGAIPFEELLALQYKAQPQDRPEILYDIGDGNFQSLAAISVGQKCTAMLLMALSDGAMPIVIDQPEDSLDIRSIWNDMCKKLRDGKETRQFIFTTHNSSLAVASDTDCYLVLDGDASHGRLVHVGSMDHQPLSAEVMKYLEGGKETYELKFEKYGGARSQS